SDLDFPVASGCIRALPSWPDDWREATRMTGLHRFLQFLGGPEGHLPARLDLDRLAGRRVAPHAGGPFAHLQDAETADADAVALLEVLDDHADQIVEDGLRVLLRHLMIGGQAGG